MFLCACVQYKKFGNTYVKFATEEQAHKALVNLRGRYFCGRIVQAEYSPVTDFREGRCRQFDERNCLRGGYCNFLHLKSTPRFARRYLRRTRLRNRYRHPYGLHYQTKRRDDSWPRFPIRGTSEERRRCIKKWNNVLDEERKDGKHKKRVEKEEDGGGNQMMSRLMNSANGMMNIANALGINQGSANAVNFMFGEGMNANSGLMGMGPPAVVAQSVKMEVDGAVNGSDNKSGGDVNTSFGGAFINPERLRMINST